MINHWCYFCLILVSYLIDKKNCLKIILCFIRLVIINPSINMEIISSIVNYEGHLESKERFAFNKYLLVIGKEKNMQGITHLHLLLHIVTLDIESLVVPWHQFTYSLLVPDGRLAIQPVHDSVLQVLIICVSFTSKVLLHLQEEVKVRWCQVRTVWRMVECVPMEFITQPLAAWWIPLGHSRCPSYNSCSESEMSWPQFVFSFPYKNGEYFTVI